MKIVAIQRTSLLRRLWRHTWHRKPRKTTNKSESDGPKAAKAANVVAVKVFYFD